MISQDMTYLIELKMPPYMNKTNKKRCTFLLKAHRLIGLQHKDMISENN